MGVSQCIYIVTTWVHIVPLGESVWLCPEPSCTVPNEVVESGQVLRPTNLSASELFRSGEVFEVFVIREYEHGMGGAFEVVVPLLESFEDCQELFVIDFVVKLGGLHSSGVKGNRVQVTIVGRDLGNNGHDDVV